MLTSDSHDGLVLAHERTRRLRAEAAAERLRAPSALRHGVAVLLRGAANRVEPTPLRAGFGRPVLVKDR